MLHAGEQIKRFTEKYRTTLDNLRSQGLTEDADYKMHEDFIEWEYWDDVMQDTEMAMRSIKALLEKLEGAVVDKQMPPEIGETAIEVEG